MTANVPLPEFPIVVVGTGFAGLGMAIRFKQAGIHSFVVLEKADDAGGTWRDNRYTGCACDVPSHLYSYSFEPNPTLTQHFRFDDYILRPQEQTARHRETERKIA